jgi:hypothetical protein
MFPPADTLTDPEHEYSPLWARLMFALPRTDNNKNIINKMISTKNDLALLSILAQSIYMLQQFAQSW